MTETTAAENDDRTVWNCFQWIFFIYLSASQLALSIFRCAVLIYTRVHIHSIAAYSTAQYIELFMFQTHPITINVFHTLSSNCVVWKKYKFTFFSSLVFSFPFVRIELCARELCACTHSVWVLVSATAMENNNIDRDGMFSRKKGRISIKWQK